MISNAICKHFLRICALTWMLLARFHLVFSSSLLFIIHWVFQIGDRLSRINFLSFLCRYSSSRQQLQQQQKHQQFRDMDYYQQYPQYGANTGGTTGQVYDAMIPHPAYVPHSALVTNSYAPFYSTLPGNVYPSPPVYQHPQLTPYTNTSYVHHVTQAAEGPVFFSPQGFVPVLPVTH